MQEEELKEEKYIDRLYSSNISLFCLPGVAAAVHMQTGLPVSPPSLPVIFLTKKKIFFSAQSLSLEAHFNIKVQLIFEIVYSLERWNKMENESFFFFFLIN